MTQKLDIPLFAKSSYNERKRSLPERLFTQDDFSQRNKIKTKYIQLVKDRQRSLEEGEKLSETFHNSSRMPSIRKVRDEKKKLSDDLLQSVCHYNYKLVSEQRKKRLFVLKKNKYQKIKLIRQNHQKESMQNTRIRTMMEREIFQEKKKKKKLVENEKQSASMAIIQKTNQKKNSGKELREQKGQFKKVISSQKTMSLTLKKKLNCLVRQSETKAHQERKKSFEKVKTEGIKNYLLRMATELKNKTKVQELSSVARVKLGSESNKLEKLSTKYEGKIRVYQSFLKEKASLKKKNSEFIEKKSISTGLTKST